jgi:hypothetical protein
MSEINDKDNLINLLDSLLDSLTASVPNDIGSYKSVWTEDEIQVLKKKIMKLLDKLA